MVGTAELVGTLLRVLNGFHLHRSPALQRAHSKALILGNGPSLRGDLDGLYRLAATDSVDFWCVNFFANADAYPALKPTNYVIADPGHWEDDIPERLKEQREEFLRRLLEVTRWDMVFHVPYSARGTSFVMRLATNPHLKVRFFNQTTVGCQIEALAFWLYRRELAMPAPQNVLIPSLFLTILAEYETVGIVGADHSWHRDIIVKDAVVMLRDPHFYDDDNEVRPFYKNATQTYTMAEIFQIWSKVFTQYERLAAFARSQKVNVVNSSSVSYIDSFKTRTLREF